MAKKDHQQQPYDTSFKALLRKQMSDMLQYLVPGATYMEELNTDIFKPHPPLRGDKACKILHNDIIKILHIEVEMHGKSRMPHRMNSYAALLLEEYDLPVLSMIIYPFKTTLPQSPLLIKDGEQTLLEFHFVPLGLWTLEAEKFIQQQAVSMYPLLPTMNGVTVAMLLEAFKTMTQTYQGLELTHRLIWFRTFLRRVNTLPVRTKRIIEEELHMFDELLKDDPWIKQLQAQAAKQAAEEATAKATAKAAKQAEQAAKQAEIKTLRNTVLVAVQTRFPALATLAQQRVSRIKDQQRLQQLIGLIYTAPDEAAARTHLETPNP